MGSKYRVDVYYMEDLLSKIYVDGESVRVENFSDDIVWRPFGVLTDVTYQDLMEFYEERCFPKDRQNRNEILDLMGLPCYDTEMICRVTHGTQFDDFLWMNFSDEAQKTFEEIRLRQEKFFQLPIDFYDILCYTIVCNHLNVIAINKIWLTQ